MSRREDNMKDDSCNERGWIAREIEMKRDIELPMTIRTYETYLCEKSDWIDEGDLTGESFSTTEGNARRACLN